MKKAFILTSAGAEFKPMDPKAEDVYIQDIAHALSNQCRFGGHTSSFYSVAQHSVLVMEIVDKLDGTLGQQFAALMHDAAEAYLVDLPTPIKKQMAGYAVAEIRVLAAISSRLGFRLEHDPLVKKADLIALATEARDLMPPHSIWDQLPEKPVAPTLVPWPPGEGSKHFMDSFRRINAELKVQHENSRV